MWEIDEAAFAIFELNAERFEFEDALAHPNQRRRKEGSPVDAAIRFGLLGGAAGFFAKRAQLSMGALNLFDDGAHFGKQPVRLFDREEFHGAFRNPFFTRSDGLSGRMRFSLIRYAYQSR